MYGAVISVIVLLQRFCLKIHKLMISKSLDSSTLFLTLLIIFVSSSNDGNVEMDLKIQLHSKGYNTRLI